MASDSKLKIIGPGGEPVDASDEGKLKIIGQEKTPLLAKQPSTAPPASQFQVGTPEQQKEWYDQTVSFRKIAGQTAVMTLGLSPEIQAMPWLIRAGHMGLFGMGAEAWSQNISRILGFKAPTTSQEAVKQMEKEGLFQFSAEAGGAVVGGIASRLGATAVRAKELLDTARSYSLPITGPEVTGSGFGKTVQQIGERLLFGKKFASKMREKFFAGLNVAADDTVATLSKQMTQTEAGTAVQDAFGIAESKFKEMSSSLYEGFIGRVEQATGKAPIINISQRAFDEAKVIQKEMGQVTAKYPTIMKMSAEEEKVFNSIYPGVKEGMDLSRMKQPTQLPPLTLREAQRLRSRLRDIARESTNIDARRLAVRSEKVLDDTMKETLDKIPSGTGSTFKTELDGIDAAYREGKELFDGKAFSNLVAKYPEELAHSIRITDVSKMRDVHKALVKYAKDPDTWDLFRRMWLQDKMRVPEMAAGEPGQTLAKGIANLSTDLRTKGRAITSEFFSDAKGAEVLHNLNRLAKVVESKSSLSPVADSNLFVNWSTVHALLMGGMMVTHHLPAALVTASVPPALVRIMYNRPVTDTIVNLMSAAGKAGRVFTPGEIAQLSRAMRLAFEGQEVVEKAKQ